MITCPSCGHENVPGTQFCEGCGEELEAATGSGAADTGDTAGAAEDTAASGEVRCPACDNLNPADNAVCEVCGTELPGGAAASTPALSGSVGDADSQPSADAPAATPAATQPDDDSIAGDDDNATIQVPASAPPAGGGIASAPAGQLGGTTDAISTAPDVPAPQAPSPQPAPVTITEPAPDDAPGDTAVVAAGSTSDASTPSVDLEPGRVKLVVEQGMNVGKQFVLGDSEVAVGREDEEEEIYPDIDLSDQDEGYVHREHAKLQFQDGKLNVTHLGGANKTRVNNRPIPDNEPQPLKMGDKISFGKVVLRVHPHS